MITKKMMVTTNTRIEYSDKNIFRTVFSCNNEGFFRQAYFLRTERDRETETETEKERERKMDGWMDGWI